MDARYGNPIAAEGSGAGRTCLLLLLFLLVTATPVGGVFAELPESCVVSGSTNRTCAASSGVALSGPLDSFWRDTGSSTLSGWFRVCLNGLIMIVR